ncbi:hypothetical protein BCR32DRAFT_196992, partial [Anaeromyces robustus]
DTSPKIRSLVAQGLKLEKLDKSQSKVSGVIDNVCASTIMVNICNHIYKKKRHEPKEDNIAMVDITVDGI